MGYRAEQEF